MATVSSLDSALIRTIAADFARATEMAVVVVNIHGEEISERFNFSTFCQKMRQDPKRYQQCMQSDRRGGLKASADNKPCVYRCHAGLTDFSIPMIIEGHLVGFVLCGQVRLQDDESNSLLDILDFHEEWSKNQELNKYYQDIPVVDFQKVQASAQLLQLIVDNCIRKHINLMVIDATDTDHEPKSLHSAACYDHKIKKALRYIDNHFCDDLKLEDVAAHVYLSPYYFSKLFKKQQGIGFNAYLNKHRMLHAQKMLTNSDLPIAIIAKNLGFSQTSYFCKVFRKICEMTPQEFRDQHYRGEVLYE